MHAPACAMICLTRSIFALQYFSPNERRTNFGRGPGLPKRASFR
ncbi:MAG TPA: hypothetical protein VHW03_01960 [Chthoniobacterales bacterium]|nr:hypothetical protein [Chthoniobacterales bacterium]